MDIIEINIKPHIPFFVKRSVYDSLPKLSLLSLKFLSFTLKRKNKEAKIIINIEIIFKNGKSNERIIRQKFSSLKISFKSFFEYS